MHCEGIVTNFFYQNFAFSAILSHTYQSESSEYRQSLYIFQAKVNQAGYDNDQVKYIPAYFKIVLPKGSDFDDSFQGKDSSEYLKTKWLTL